MFEKINEHLFALVANPVSPVGSLTPPVRLPGSPRPVRLAFAAFLPGVSLHLKRFTLF
jgi:hypothetical protein